MRVCFSFIDFCVVESFAYDQTLPRHFCGPCILLPRGQISAVCGLHFTLSFCYFILECSKTYIFHGIRYFIRNIYKNVNFLQIIYNNTIKSIFLKKYHIFVKYLQKYDLQLLHPHLQHRFATLEIRLHKWQIKLLIGNDCKKMLYKLQIVYCYISSK